MGEITTGAGVGLLVTNESAGNSVGVPVLLLLGGSSFGLASNVSVGAVVGSDIEAGVGASTSSPFTESACGDGGLEMGE